MKRVLMFVLVCVLPMVANATGMCVHTNTYVGQLLASRDGVSYETGDGGAWLVNTDYVTSSFNTPIIKGASACIEKEGVVNTADSTVTALSGELVEPHCWCAMAKPLISDWVYVKTFDTLAECGSGCASACGNAVMTSTALRTSMFQAIW